jgi:thiamine biosynthesis lipoprotein
LILQKHRRMTKLTSCIFTGLLFMITANANPAPKKPVRLYVSHFENVLGTSLELKTYAVARADADIADDAARKEIQRIGNILSAYDPASEFSAWLKTKDQAVKVSPELFEVLGLFDQWRMNTDGALDASAEIITRVWKSSAAANRVPTDQELAAAVARVKQPHWSLDPVAHTATHLDKAPLMLNSFAKSYIIAHAAAAAMATGKVSAIVVNIGGDLVVTGDLMERINISDPKADAENDAPMDRLLIGKRAIATSGNYRRGELIAGHWYSHIVDPRTGQPADQILSATVIAPDASTAGALATSFNVLTPAESVRLAGRYPDVDYLIITRDGERFSSKGWSSLEAPGWNGPSGAKVGAGRESTGARTSTGGTSTSWDDFELVIDLQINLQSETFVKRPYVAVWVEDADHTPVRTIALWHERDKYLPELKSWYLKYQGDYSTDKKFLGSSSGATRSAGKYTMKWDGKDDKGKVVKPGVYTVKIEVSREHGTYQLMRQQLDFNDTPQKIDIPGNIEISSVTLDYRKKDAAR